MSLIVYRIQDSDGRGPFRPGFSHWWVEERDDHKNLVPWFQEFGRHAIPPNNLHTGCGCRTLDQLRRWFTRIEYSRLLAYGFHAVEIGADSVLHESGIQLLFQRAKPLRIDVVPFDLYANAEVGP